MKEIKLCWEDFKNLAEEILSKTNGRKNCKGQNLFPLFRGQRNSTWGLKSSLERCLEELQIKKNNGDLKNIDTSLSFEKYKQIMAFAYEKSKNKLPHKWNLSKEEITKCNNLNLFEETKVLDYMIYLRHHEFPTPILDWTENYHVAAFFAFNKKHDNEDAAIFIYLETINASKGYSLETPHIELFQTKSKVHYRHINQQAHYTVCNRFRNGREFCSHDLFFDSRSNPYLKNMPTQDLFLKILIPSAEKDEILDDLSRKKITEDTLFSIEDPKNSKENLLFMQLKNELFSENF